MLWVVAAILAGLWLLGAELSYSRAGIVFVLVAAVIVAILAWAVKARSMV